MTTTILLTSMTMMLIKLEQTMKTMKTKETAIKLQKKMKTRVALIHNYKRMNKKSRTKMENLRKLMRKSRKIIIIKTLREDQKMMTQEMENHLSIYLQLVILCLKSRKRMMICTHQKRFTKSVVKAKKQRLDQQNSMVFSIGVLLLCSLSYFQYGVTSLQAYLTTGVYTTFQTNILLYRFQPGWE